ncbi:MAG: Gfo/Idh/MocA family protein [Akkermansiaceae bacterium]
MNPDPTSRRKFIATSGATAAAISFPTVLRAQNARNNETLKIGLVGCGGRGTGAASQALSADPNVKLWSIGDAFESQIPKAVKNLGKFGDKIEVPETRQFSGMDAYQKVIDSGVDLVLLTTPPGFRPQHLRAAVEAGKHVFAEKPMAVDVAGLKSVLESTRLAKKKGTTIQHGYCWRFSPNTRAGYGKLLSGELGRIVSVYGTYLANVPKPSTNADMRKEEWGDVEWQIRNWMAHEWLSAGPLLEQGIHTVDKIGWAMGDVAPIAARASGGRIQRDDEGNVYDHYDVVYEYPNGVMCHVAERQMKGAFTEVVDRVFCENGSLEAPTRVMTKDTSGKITWAYRGKNSNMYQVCHNEWVAAIREGKELNTGEFMANSTMLGMLGREAAHTGKRITWDEMWAANQDLAPDNLKMDDKRPVDPVPIPGQHKFG